MTTKDDFADLRDNAEMAEPTHERNRLRALLAALDTARGERDKAQAVTTRAHARQREALLALSPDGSSDEGLVAAARRVVAERDALRDAEAEHDTSFMLRHRADMRAIKRWQAEAPGREMTWPDHADMVVWLLETLDASRAEMAALRAHLVLVFDEAQGTIGAHGPGIRLGAPTMPLSTAKRLKRQIEGALGDGLAETIATMTGYADELRAARAETAAAVRRAEVAEARLELNDARDALDEFSSVQQAGYDEALSRANKAFAAMVKLRALGAAVDGEGS